MAYWQYVQEFKRNEELRSGQSLTNDEASQMASATWNLMSDVERKPYREKAKNKPKGAAGASNSTGERYSSQGVPLSALENEQREKRKAVLDMQTRIARLIRFYQVPGIFASQPLFFMSGNYFYQISKRFVPAEVAIVKFSLNEGVIKSYHTFVNPGPIEMGYANDAKCYAEETHRLPLPPNAFGESNFQKIYEKLMEIISDGGSNGQFDGGKPLVFTYTGDLLTEQDNIDMLKSFMEQFSPNKTNPIDIFPMTRLFYALRVELAGQKRCEAVTENVAKIIVSKYPYEMRAGLSCDYHEENDVTKYCALSKAIRWTYIMVDNLYIAMGISVFPGKQLPSNVDLNVVEKSVSDLHLDSDDSETGCDVITEEPSNASCISQLTPSIVSVQGSFLSSYPDTHTTHRSVKNSMISTSEAEIRNNGSVDDLSVSKSIDKEISKRLSRFKGFPSRNTYKIDEN